eukprot:TRINITY_DN74412_c0_g1_i1.p1 TRINITY_DN74412_c0_g1~~TRINITY_DN74412_c0_g1_i1.p1  ORF type:complete len:908 (-),score=186.70 TRINITY_DN74412_c0_g1_i1:126-2849(-)
MEAERLPPNISSNFGEVAGGSSNPGGWAGTVRKPSKTRRNGDGPGPGLHWSSEASSQEKEVYKIETALVTFSGPRPFCPQKPSVGTRAIGFEVSARPAAPSDDAVTVPLTPLMASDPSTPSPQAGQAASSPSTSQPLLTGWLRKGSVGAGKCTPRVAFRRRFFRLDTERLQYWPLDDCAEVARGTFPVALIAAVVVHGAELVLHFDRLQKTGKRHVPRDSLRLIATSLIEAEQWATALRAAAAQYLGAALPPGWDNTVPEKRVVRIALERNVVAALQHLLDYAFECKRTKDRGKESLPVRLEVVKAEAIQGVAAWLKYARARSRLRARAEAPGALTRLEPGILTGGADVCDVLGELDEAANEQWLFHGTTLAAVEGIVGHDFRIDLAGSHRGTLYGRGIYLAECSSKADEYADEAEDGLCRVLLCRAALGRVLVDKQKRPSAELESQCKAGFDSVCGDRAAAVGTFREFILYDDTQVYTSFVVHYRRTPLVEFTKRLSSAADSQDTSTAKHLTMLAARLAEDHPDKVVKLQLLASLTEKPLVTGPLLAEILRQDRRPAVRRAAASAIAEVSERILVGPPLSLQADAFGDAVVPWLDVCLKEEPSEMVRVAAARALQSLGMRAAPALNSLIACLGGVKSVRRAAVAALSQLGELAAPAAPALIQDLDDEEAPVREMAAGILAQLHESALPAVPVLLRLVRDPEASVRQAAVVALGYLGSLFEHSVVMETLIPCLRDYNKEVRIEAATSLGCLGLDGVQATATLAPALMRCAKDSDPALRLASTEALGYFSPPLGATVQALIARLSDNEDQVRLAAAQSLGELGGHAWMAAAALRERTRDMNSAVCAAAAAALKTMPEEEPQELELQPWVSKDRKDTGAALSVRQQIYNRRRERRRHIGAMQAQQHLNR